MVQAISDDRYPPYPLRYLTDRFSSLVVVPLTQICGYGAQLSFAVRLQAAEFFNDLGVKRDPTAGRWLHSGLLADPPGHPGRIGGVIARHFSPKVFRLQRIEQHTCAKIQ